MGSPHPETLALEANGDIITFTDDDALPFPEWLEEIVKTFTGGDSIIGVTGLALPLWQEESMNWFPEEFYWMIGCTAFSKLTEVEEVRNAWGANMSFTKEAFISCLLKCYLQALNCKRVFSSHIDVTPYRADSVACYSHTLQKSVWVSLN